MNGPDDQPDALLAEIRAALRASRPDADLDSLRFLAVGEYTYNYRVRLNGRDAVLRIVTGSQMGLNAPDQTLYEAQALGLLAPTGRTPLLIDVEPDAAALTHPYLLISYLPGRPLDYCADLTEAARCVAEIHRHVLPRDHALQHHADPVASILTEARRLLEGIIDGRGVLDLCDRIRGMPEGTFSTLRVDQTVINTDLNSHNFIVNDGRAWLVDWEKARIGPSLMDVAHFLLPTTTLWRDQTATRLSSKQKEAFLTAYLDARPELDPQTYRAALRPAMQLAAVRALAWCAWALSASQRGDRAIENVETLAKCRQFTSNDFLTALEAELWG